MDEKTRLHLDQLAKDARTAGGNVFHISDRTPSMLGSPYAGNAVVVLPQKEYSAGEDVLFKTGGKKNYLHRITHVKPGFVFTKGTFNQVGDGWIPIADVFGKVVQVVRKDGKE